MAAAATVAVATVEAVAATEAAWLGLFAFQVLSVTGLLH